MHLLGRCMCVLVLLQVNGFNILFEWIGTNEGTKEFKKLRGKK